MIPIRVPTDAPLYTVGDARTIDPGGPLADVLCPVCDGPVTDSPVTLVYVGTHPDDRKTFGWTTGAGVIVHTACAGPGQAP